MDEAHGRRITGSQHCCLADTVEAVIGNAERLIERVGGVPVLRVVVAPVLFQAIARGQLLVHLPDPCAFNAAKLLNAPAAGRLLAKA